MTTYALETRVAPRVLCVDDEPLVLNSLRRVLSPAFAVTTAASSSEALDILQHRGPFAVIVSDMQMPGMNGAALLGRARQVAPFTVRVLLTGRADLEASVAAVNQGQIFRFLTKPCAPDMLLRGMDDAVRQYQLLTSERILLERTLHGSIQVLTDILAVVQPEAFARAARVKQYTVEIAERLDLSDRWYLEVAAMCSQLGVVTLPPETAKKLYQGASLTEAEQAMVARLPQFTRGLLANIPRLEPIREILAYMHKRFDGVGPPEDQLAGEHLPLGARILKIALDFDDLQAQGLVSGEALAVMHDRTRWYDPRILAAFSKGRGQAAPPERCVTLPLKAVTPGMILLEDVRAANGVLLIARGQPMTAGLAERLRNMAWQAATDTVRVSVPEPPAPEQPASRSAPAKPVAAEPARPFAQGAVGAQAGEGRGDGGHPALARHP